MSVTNLRQFLGLAIERTNWKTRAFRVEQVSTVSISDLEIGAAECTGVKIQTKEIYYSQQGDFEFLNFSTGFCEQSHHLQEKKRQIEHKTGR